MDPSTPSGNPVVDDDPRLRRKIEPDPTRPAFMRTVDEACQRFNPRTGAA